MLWRKFIKSAILVQTCSDCLGLCSIVHDTIDHFVRWFSHNLFCLICTRNSIQTISVNTYMRLTHRHTRFYTSSAAVDIKIVSPKSVYTNEIEQLLFNEIHLRCTKCHSIYTDKIFQTHSTEFMCCVLRCRYAIVIYCTLYNECRVQSPKSDCGVTDIELNLKKKNTKNKSAIHFVIS